MEWKEFKTAPRDGTLILACIKNLDVYEPHLIYHGNNSWMIEDLYLSEAFFEPVIVGWHPIPEIPQKKHLCLSDIDSNIYTESKEGKLYLHIYEQDSITVNYCPFCGET